MPEQTNTQETQEAQKEEKSALEQALENLPDIMANRKIEREHETILLDADFTPSTAHSQAFCFVTGDNNYELHRQISPALLQFSACMHQIRRTISETSEEGEDYLAYPLVLTEFSNDMMVLNDMPYKLQVEITRNEGIKASARILSPRTHSQVFSLDAIFEQGKPLFQDFKNPAYLGLFMGKNLAGFGKVIGADSAERTLYVMTGFPSALFNAVKIGSLKPEAEKTGIFYGTQMMYFDASTGPDPEEVVLGLYVNPETFGKSIRNQDLMFSARKKDDRTICQAYFPLKFVRKENLQRMVDKTKKFEDSFKGN